MDRVLASGGIRSGVDVARVLALGARLAGLALPVVRAVVQGGPDAVVEHLERVHRTLRRAMLLTGSRDLEALRWGKVWLDPELDECARRLRAAERESGDRETPRGSPDADTRSKG